MGISGLLRVAALVLFILAAILCHWTVNGSDLADALLLGFAGLACWCASTFNEPRRVP